MRRSKIEEEDEEEEEQEEEEEEEQEEQEEEYKLRPANKSDRRTSTVIQCRLDNAHCDIIYLSSPTQRQKQVISMLH